MPVTQVNGRVTLTHPKVCDNQIHENTMSPALIILNRAPLRNYFFMVQRSLRGNLEPSPNLNQSSGYSSHPKPPSMGQNRCGEASQLYSHALELLPTQSICDSASMVSQEV
jgi:hypothetical protein